MLFGNVIFMNFIIAVVSESYENCMSKMIAQTYKVKFDLSVEREQIMSNRDKENLKYFPNYIVLRRPVGSLGDGGQAWQGFVKEIKLSTEAHINRLSDDIRTQLKEAQKMNMKQIQKKLEEMETSLQGNTNEKLERMEANILERLNDQLAHHEVGSQ